MGKKGYTLPKHIVIDDTPSSIKGQWVFSKNNPVIAGVSKETYVYANWQDLLDNKPLYCIHDKDV